MKVAKNKSFLLMIFIFILFIFPLPVFASVTIVSGDLNTIGSTIKIGDDFFYVIGKEDDTHVNVMAKYNLGIGYGFEENPVYKQTIFAIGRLEGNIPTLGGVCLSTTGFNFPGPNSPIVVDGFNHYAEYLTNEGAVFSNLSVLTYDKYIELIENVDRGLYAPVGREFMYQTAYWVSDEYAFPRTGNGYYRRFVYLNSTDSLVGYGFCPYEWGIRPTFTLEINGNLETEEISFPVIKPNLTNSKYTLGETYKIGNEEFYVIGKEDDTHLKLLSKYNLGIGKGFDIPNYKQEKTATGWSADSDSIKGTLRFSSNAYWANSHSLKTTLQDKYGTTYPAYVYDESSNIKEIINNYVDYLKTKDVSVTARLIKQEELNGLGCNPYKYSCQNAPEWVYSTSYWTGSLANPAFLNYVNTSGRFGEDSYMQEIRYGVRPVILLEIEKEEQEKKDEDTNLTLDSEEANGWNDKEKLENPKTGAFISISIILLLIIGGIILIIYSKKKNKFKKL